MLCYLLLFVSSLSSVQTLAVSGPQCSANWTESDREAIISVHSKKRQNISRIKLQYDCDLETAAQYWAKKCCPDESSCSGNQIERAEMLSVSSKGSVSLLIEPYFLCFL